MKLTKGIFALIISFTCASCVMSLGAAIASQTTAARSEELQNAVTADKANPVVAETAGNETNYIIKECNGAIGIFTSDGNQVGIVAVNTVTLPAQDRQRLSDGIEISGDDALAEFIEDFTG